METTRQELDNTYESRDLILTSDIRRHLYRAAGWAKFLAIIGFAMVGCMLVISISMKYIMDENTSDLGDMYPPETSTFYFSAIYLLMAILCFFPYLYMFRFATRMQFAISKGDQADLEFSLKNLKMLFTFGGILTIIGFVFMVIILFLVVAFISSLASFRY